MPEAVLAVFLAVLAVFLAVLAVFPHHHTSALGYLQKERRGAEEEAEKGPHLIFVIRLALILCPRQNIATGATGRLQAAAWQ